MVWQIAREQYGYHQDWPPQHSAQIYFTRYRDSAKAPLVYNGKSALPEFPRRP